MTILCSNTSSSFRSALEGFPSGKASDALGVFGMLCDDTLSAAWGSACMFISEDLRLPLLPSLGSGISVFTWSGGVRRPVPCPRVKEPLCIRCAILPGSGAMPPEGLLTAPLPSGGRSPP
eukprot:CAMPEP_0173435630 /NCGR_PEP_ID=MMETSP1357-20121228/15505_1 /TAXON_ID=77926 /ORGANISM="Hemiselmis rufescens, Strain PCC563" /LENGTH=119 /DNA_ID=CAMNT_0014400641 /DNA_START=70 /DNA_END=425 /DNA_ORIENTATION=-